MRSKGSYFWLSASLCRQEQQQYAQSACLYRSLAKIHIAMATNGTPVSTNPTSSAAVTAVPPTPPATASSGIAAASIDPAILQAVRTAVQQEVRAHLNPATSSRSGSNTTAFSGATGVAAASPAPSAPTGTAIGKPM